LLTLTLRHYAIAERWSATPAARQMKKSQPLATLTYDSQLADTPVGHYLLKRHCQMSVTFTGRQPDAGMRCISAASPARLILPSAAAPAAPLAGQRQPCQMPAM